MKQAFLAVLACSWAAAAQAQQTVLAGNPGGVWTMAWSPDGKLLASAGAENDIRLWDAESGKPGLVLSGHRGAVHCVTFSPDGTAIASASADKTIRSWDPASGKVNHVFKGHTDAVKGVAFAPDGLSLASAGKEGKVRLWDTRSGKETRVLRSGFPYCVAYSPKGDTLAQGDFDKIRLWDPKLGIERDPLVHPDHVNFIVYSRDGKNLASCGNDGSVRVWYARADRERFILKDHRGIVHGVSFSTDGMTLATGGEDRILRFWETNAGTLAESRAVFGVIRSLAFSPKSGILAVGLADGSIQLHDATAILRANQK